jgi:hypothetical protein
MRHKYTVLTRTDGSGPYQRRAITHAEARDTLEALGVDAGVEVDGIAVGSVREMRKAQTLARTKSIDQLRGSCAAEAAATVHALQNAQAVLNRIRQAAGS